MFALFTPLLIASLTQVGHTYSIGEGATNRAAAQRVLDDQHHFGDPVAGADIQKALADPAFQYIDPPVPCKVVPQIIRPGTAVACVIQSGKLRGKLYYATELDLGGVEPY
jgi:hypothetical protein